MAYHEPLSKTPTCAVLFGLSEEHFHSCWLVHHLPTRSDIVFFAWRFMLILCTAAMLWERPLNRFDALFVLFKRRALQSVFQGHCVSCCFVFTRMLSPFVRGLFWIALTFDRYHRVCFDVPVRLSTEVRICFSLGGVYSSWIEERAKTN
jgi:hypothetical protein